VTDAGLTVALDRPLPATLQASKATALLVQGVCSAAGSPVRELTIGVGGVSYPVRAAGMVRGDQPPGSPAAHGGFWALVPIPARAQGETTAVDLRARLADGRTLTAPLAAIAAVAPAAPAAVARPAADDRPLIAVCMATFEPDEALFRAQVASLRAQTDQAWVCVVSDDASGPAHLRMIEQVLDGDERFCLTPSPTRQGFYRNFERALELAPAGAELVALCDQDDVWHPDKLATLREAIGDAALVFSDQRLTDPAGVVLRDTLWEGRRPTHDNMTSMVVANTITGASALMRRDLADLALPFPDGPGFQFHDHWIGLLALARGRVAYVDRPLYDYVQHSGAVFGDVASGARGAAGVEATAAARAAYFYGYLACAVMVQTALLRCNGQLSAPKQRALTRFLDADRRLGAALALAVRPARELLGRNETLGTESVLVRGLVWRAVATRLRNRRRVPRRLTDAAPPPLHAFSQARMRRWRASVSSPGR
jgi:glycosyltransferase involved in cell wall biosynthesis